LLQMAWIPDGGSLEMLKLMALDPHWTCDELGRHGMGISFECPIHRTHRLAVPFANPVDGGAKMSDRGYGGGPDHWWQRTGETFDTLTLGPSVDASGNVFPVDKNGAGNIKTHCWHGFIVNGEVTWKPTIVIDPKRTNVKAFLTTVDKLNTHGKGYDIRSEPGGMIPSVNDQGVIEGFSIACPGCGCWGGIQFVADEHFKDPWRVVGGSVDDVTTLSVKDSILKHCCGWHGYLKDGIFVSC